MPHVQAHKDATIGRVVLERAVVQVNEAKRFLYQLGQLLCDKVRLLLVPGRHGVVVEGESVDDGDEQE